MKKSIILLLIAILLMTCVACGKNTTSSVEKNTVNSEEATGKKVLIAYFTRADNIDKNEKVDAVSSASLNMQNDKVIGNTAIIGEDIQKAVGGNLVSIKTTNLYPVDYNSNINVASNEQKDNARPKLSIHVDNMDDYDIIFIGYPNWWGTIPMPMYTFLEEYDFSGKTIIPFCTHKGSQLGNSVNDIKKLCPNAKVLDGIAVRGEKAIDAQEDVSKWLRKIGMLQ